MGLFSKFNDSLSKTKKGFVEKLFDTFTGKEIDDDLYEELEETLIQGDVGVETALDLVERLREREKTDKLKYAEQLKDVLVEEIAAIMGDEVAALNLDDNSLNIILMVGVNGVGKTTSIGKLANKLKKEGHKVILGAGDTFRAAAAEQLKVWGQRVGCDVISHQEGADPAAVVFDAIAAAKSRNCDVLIVDTAGRLQNKANLMNELAKMRKVIDREAPGCLKEVLLVLDATTGQNAISQAKTFGEASGVTGVILTKLDGTAKGGVVIGIRSEFDLPVKLIGTGEQIDDMEYFDAKEFGRALFSGDDDVFQSEAEEFIEDVKEEIAETVADIKEEVAELKADVQIAAEIIKEEAAEYKAETQTLVEEIVEDIKEEAAEWKAEAEEFVADVQEEIADLMDAPQADDLDEYNDVQEAEEKPKKKGFFGGLFGGRK
ncbi:MAG: signal recognition particle-docking protein FtsY [Peptococcaceae bacterium]|nr:signal recognition particle-docking protein FtsY [Peptococcaceae bacterium]MBP3625742.1 signal recognition particle-docking protein FtsY [Peptococcaceae bacterium]